MAHTPSRRALLTGFAASPILTAFGAGGLAKDAGVERRPPTSGGRLVGAAVRMDQIEADAALRRTLLSDCASVTPEIHMKWDALQPAADTWRTGPADALVGFADRHGLLVRGHTLLWDQSTPAWARERMLETRDRSVLDRYFDAVLGRYDTVGEWDVVNEPIDTENGARDGLRANTFLRSYGRGYIDHALRRARQAAPRARLMINDFSFDYDNPVEARRRAALLRLIERLRSDGAPLDGIGVQAHLDLSKGPLRPEILQPFLREIAGFGLSIAITELDVKEDDLTVSIVERDQRVADEVRRYLDIVLDEPAVQGVTTWGLSDAHSWLRDPGAEGLALNRGLPYDADLRPKPMHAAIRRSLTA